MNGRLFSLVVGGLLVGATILVLIKIDFGPYLLGATQLWDFDVYYQLAHDSLAGSNPYQVSYMQTAGPPLVILPFALFLFNSLQVARSMMAVISLLAVWATAYILARSIYPAKLWLVALALQLIFLLSFPVRFNFITGQPNLVLMFLATIVITGMHETWKGISVGLMIVLKTNYLLMLIPLLRRRSRTALVALATVGLCILVSLLLFKPSIYQEYFSQRVGSYFLSVPVIEDVDYYNQSLRSTMARFEMGTWYVAIFLSLAIAAGSYLLVSGDIKSGLLFSLLLSPIVWQHYIVVVYPLLVLTGIRCWGNRWRFGLWVLSVFLLIGHLPYLHGHALDFWHSLGASHYFLGLVLLLGIQMWLHNKYRESIE